MEEVIYDEDDFIDISKATLGEILDEIKYQELLDEED